MCDDSCDSGAGDSSPSEPCHDNGTSEQISYLWANAHTDPPPPATSRPLPGASLVRPPTGLRPAAVAVGYPRHLRIYEVACAMLRYSDAGVRIPHEWADELVRLSDPSHDLARFNVSRHNGEHSLSDARQMAVTEEVQHLRDRLEAAGAEIRRLEVARVYHRDAARAIVDATKHANAVRADWCNKPWWRRAYDAIRRPEMLR